MLVLRSAFLEDLVVRLLEKCLMIDNHDFLSVEFGWTAIDMEGSVSYFATAGFGPIPEAAADYDETLEVWEEIQKLPRTGGFIESVPGRNKHR